MPLIGADEDLAVAVGDADGDDRIAFFDAHRDDATRPRVAERAQLGLLDDAAPRAHDDELVLLELLDRQERRDSFACLHRHQVRDRLAAAVGSDVGDLVNLQPVGAATIREDHDVGVARGDEEMADEVLFPRPHADAALAAAALVPVVGDRGALDVAGVADRDRHVFLGDQILDAELALFGKDLGSARVAVLLLNRAQLVDDDLHHQAVAAEDGHQALDQLQQLGELGEDLLPLETGQALQLHVEDRLRLDQRQAELRDQSVARLGGIAGPSDQRNHRVEVIERNLQAFENVPARFRLAQLELGSPANDLSAELDEALDQLQQRQHLRPPADDREHDDAERRLQLRVLVQVVQHDVAELAALQIDDDPHAVAIGFVANVRDAFNGLGVDQLRDVLDQALLVDLIRNRGDDDGRAIALLRDLDLGLRAHDDRAAAGEVRLLDAVAADDVAAGGEVGARARARAASAASREASASRQPGCSRSSR